MRTAIGWGALGLLGLLASAAYAAELPNPEDGVINGIDAIGIWVTDLGYDALHRTIFSPRGFSAHIFPGRDWRREEVYPCGAWFLPSPESHDFFIEGNGKVSPLLGAFSFSGRTRQGVGKLAVFPVVAAGRIMVAIAGGLPKDATVRLHHLSSHIIDGSIHRGMQRWATVDGAGRGIRMPAGPVLALLFDERADRYIAIARPVTLSAGGWANVELTPPARGTSSPVPYQRGQPMVPGVALRGRQRRGYGKRSRRRAAGSMWMSSGAWACRGSPSIWAAKPAGARRRRRSVWKCSVSGRER